MTFTLFVGIWLCAYRLTRIVTKDSLLERQRRTWFRWFPPDAAHAQLADKPRVSKWGQLVQCPFCIGFWLSGAVVLVVANWHPMSISMPVLWWFATSSAVGLTAKTLD